MEILRGHVLQVLRKGTRALGNGRGLSWCRALGGRLHWNLLYALPGETIADCEEILRMLPAIRFLDPPASLQPVCAHRGSEYQEHPEVYDLGVPRLPAPYRHLYPFPERELLDITAWVEFDGGPLALNAALHGSLEEEVALWRREHGMGELRRVGRDGPHLLLKDTRPGAAPSVAALDAVESWLYDACDGIADCRELSHLMPVDLRGRGGRPGDLAARLTSLVDRRLMINTGTRYLSLALPPRGRRRRDLNPV
jgi:hypothetical protein